MKNFFVICIAVILFNQEHAQDIVFPKDEKPSHLSGNNPVITERIPVYIPMQCPENMLWFPGAGDTSTWSCDCKVGYLYFPLNNSCHEPYQQGPCPAGSYAYLPMNDVVPICKENPCSTDGFVPYHGICHELGKSGGLCRDAKLVVNSTTYQLQCDNSAIKNR